MAVRIVGPRDITTADETVINTTSMSKTWSKGLSPFFLGPIPLYDMAAVPTATNMENAWQFAKVYPWQVTHEGLPTESYFTWAKAGWSDTRAQRYPMGKGCRPAFTWWAGNKLDYIAARKRVYVPLYAKAVVAAPAFAQLLTLYRNTGDVTLWDFDGYDHATLGMSMKDVVNDPTRKMGHAFVIAHLLESMR